MTQEQIETALKTRISAAGLVWPIAWPNVNATGVAPFITVEIVPTERSDDTLDGVGLIQRGFVLMKAVMKEGEGEGAANRKADEIIGLFPRGLTIPLSGGRDISIYRPAEALQGFPSGQHWHKPVRVHFEAF